MTVWALGRYRGLMRNDPSVPRVDIDRNLDRRDL